MNIVTINLIMLIITLNLNGLNAPTKRQRLLQWSKTRHNYMLYTISESEVKLLSRV